MIHTARKNLYEHLPLQTPFSVHVFPMYACNFKCVYCLHALDAAVLRAKGFTRQAMDFSVFKKTVDSITAYPDRLRALIFAGHGEPLLHKDICSMVAYAKEKDIAERVEITTNASLLDKKTADGLIAAGVDRLKISIQGTSAAKYKAIAGVEFDFETFVSNLAYFHSHKKHTEVYVKIIDIALDGDKDEAFFTKTFTPVADVVNVEYAIPFIKELDKDVYNKEFDRCKQGNRNGSAVCSMPFYMQVVAPNGDILPCCSSDVPLVLGNICRTSLPEAWYGTALNRFFRLQLTDIGKNPVCRGCSVPRFGLQEGDYLDGHQSALLKKYTCEMHQ